MLLPKVFLTNEDGNVLPAPLQKPFRYAYRGDGMYRILVEPAPTSTPTTEDDNQLPRIPLTTPAAKREQCKRKTHRIVSRT